MKTVLFVCVHNAGRSQMAEAFFNDSASRQHLELRALSAGTESAGSLNPTVVAVMQEAGLEMPGQHPKAISAHVVSEASRIIGMGCGVDAAACPVKFLMAEDWGIEDPAGKPIERVRQIRDEVRQRVEKLVGEMSLSEP